MVDFFLSKARSNKSGLYFLIYNGKKCLFGDERQIERL